MQTYNLITNSFLESSFCHQDHKLFKYYIENQNALDENHLPLVQKEETKAQKII